MPTKIVPRRRKPGRRFLIVDIPEARLKDPSIAQFSQNNVTFQVDLREMPRGRRAIGRIPDNASGGTYNVQVTPPGMAPISLGQIEIVGPATTPEEADIEPMAGSVGTRIVISDPQGRMQPTDTCLMYPDGGDPQSGTPLNETDITATSLSGMVPPVAPGLYSLTVRASATDPSRFADLPFTVDL